jgi:MFS transporter, ACS family, D-galactonate transporter
MDGRESLRDSPQRWWLLVMLVTGMVICYAHRGAISVAAPYMIKDLHLSSAVMGILLSSFFWCYSFLQVPAGWFVDRFGVNKAYTLGFIIWSIALAGTGLASGLAALIMLQIVLGIGQAVAFPASARAVTNWFQNSERGIVTASYLTGVRLGQALIGAVGAAFLAIYSWKLFFLLIAVGPIFWLLPWSTFRGQRSKETPPSPSDAGAPAKSVSFLGSFALLKNRTVLGIFLGFFAYDYVWFVYTRWLAGYLSLERKFTAGEIGFWTSVPFLMMSAVILFSGAISDSLIKRGYPEIPVRKALIVIGLTIALLIVPAGLVEDRILSGWLISISLCGLGISAPNTWTLTQAVCARNLVGTVSGIQNFGGNVGGIIAPALTGFIVHKTQSFSLAFTISGMVLLLGMVSYSFLVARELSAQETELETASVPG